MFHGVGGNGRLLSFIALPLVKNGFEVICPDLPLYGYTQYKGTITYDLWVSCGAGIVEEFRNGDLPIFLFGLSAGGMLAYQVASKCPDITGIIASCILDQRNKYITKQTARNPFIAIIGNPIISAANKIAGSVKVPMKMIANMKAIA
ncbi:MAG: alpha/beta hydrolase, partial [Ruminiclostridium sp.]